MGVEVVLKNGDHRKAALTSGQGLPGPGTCGSSAVIHRGGAACWVRLCENQAQVGEVKQAASFRIR